jgi:small subunit ribosomal protein S13
MTVQHGFYSGVFISLLNLSTEYRHIVRIAGKDVDGSRKLVVAVSEISGVGYNFAHVLLNILKIDPNVRVGMITDQQISDIENGIRDPSKIGLPVWFLNRQKDIDTGQSRHLITSDWDFITKNDVEREKGVMSWRGFRHMMGLKVRGQCTRTTGRKGGAVGVRKAGRVVPTAAGVPGAAPGAPGAAPAAGAAGATATTPAGGKGTAPATAPAPAKGAAQAAGAKPAAPAKEAPKKTEKGGS